jgi:hypothetical protein
VFYSAETNAVKLIPKNLITNSKSGSVIKNYFLLFFGEKKVSFFFVGEPPFFGAKCLRNPKTPKKNLLKRAVSL